MNTYKLQIHTQNNNIKSFMFASAAVADDWYFNDTHVSRQTTQ